MIMPSWEHYGTHDESAYPELWEGCIGAWAPCLGPSGTKLFDLSGMGRNGSFVRLSPSTGWAVNKGVWSTDQAYTSGESVEYVDVLDAGTQGIVGGLARCTILATFSFKSATPANYGTLFYEATSANGYTRLGMAQYSDNHVELWGRSDNVGSAVIVASSVVPSETIVTAAGVWDSVSGVVLLYVSGVLEATTSASIGPLYSGATASPTVLGAYHHQTPSLQYSVSANIYDLRLYGRALDAKLIRLYHDERFGAYVPRRRRRFYSIPAGFLAAWARRNQQPLIGGGLR